MKIDYLQDDQYTQVGYKGLQQSQLVSTFVKMNKQNLHKMDLLQRRKLVHLRKKKNPLQLKQLVTKAKVDILTKNFIRKIKRGKVYKQVPDGISLNEQQQQGTSLLNRIYKYLETTQGLQLGPIMLCIWSFINIIQISIMVIIFSIMIAFPETSDLDYFVVARIFSVSLYILDMGLNFITQRYDIGGLKRNLRDIIKFYFQNEFTPDFFSIAMFPLSYVFKQNTMTPLVMLVALFKLKNNLKRFENYEFIYVKSNTRQQYYSLIKVFLLNFSIGHILSILLNLMASVSDSNDNWYNIVEIQNQSWDVKYIWGYYWGTNIMLTVGFGDLRATNRTQATILIFIQTLACITLAYNINCVGSIIGEIKAENQQKKKKLKYFHRMCQENKISQDLENKINNFIEESYLIKQQFELEQYEQVIQSLPKSMQSDYRKQANKSLFYVGFFNSLNSKTIMNLAQFVVRKVAHPQQIIQKKGQIQNFCILQKGCLAFTCKNGPKSNLNGTVIQKFQIQKNQSSKILSLGFVKRKILQCDVKSLYYSIYYYLSYQQLMKILQYCQMDYHFFLYMKDRQQNILGSNQIYKCKMCKDDYHTLFQCPQLHYIPMKQLIIFKHSNVKSNDKLKRNSISVDRSYRDYRTLHQAKTTILGQEKYLTQYFDEDEVKEIKDIKKYYYQKIFSTDNTNDNVFALLNRKRYSLQQQFEKFQDILTKVASSTLDFWPVECDQAANFRYYFKQYNPNRLLQFKLHPHKRKVKDLIFGLYAFKKQNKNKSIITSQGKDMLSGGISNNLNNSVLATTDFEPFDYQN